MQVTRDLNEQLMDDRERQTERQEKHVKFGEQLQLEKDQRYAKMMVKQKELENFKEKHEEIF